MRSGILSGLLALFLLGQAPPLHAQPVSDASVERLVEEVAGLNRSLDRLVALVESSLARQQVELVLRRIELKERRLAPLEAELREAENAVTRAEADLRRIDEMLDQQQRQVSRDVREGTDRPDSDTRRMIEKIEASRAFQVSRRDEQSERVRRLEDRLVDGRDELAILDEMLGNLLE